MAQGESRPTGSRIVKETEMVQIDDRVQRTHPASDTYAMGRTDHEEQRLRHQAARHTAPTRQLFTAAGIGPGMRVLDLGSGAGDVALVAAELVGPAGRVVGVDMNPAILETARRRATEAGHANVTFLAGNLSDLRPEGAIDALIGRAILLHLPDPAAVLRRLVPYLRPRGVAAFYEPDLTVPQMSYPPSPTADQVNGWVRAALAYAGVTMNTGMRLHQIFLEAGLEAPQMTIYARMGGSRAFVEEFAAGATENIRSLLPMLIKGGIATEQEIDIESLAARYRDDVLQRGSVIRSAFWMGAWAHAA
jgi:ubiquinone/menaquinone biosynthesis C-methylase UbiE